MSATIEQRLEAVETVVADLKQREESGTPNWIERVTGSFRNEPAFEEVLAYGRAFRAADRPEDVNP